MKDLNILQSLFHSVQQPAHPPHVGEAFFLWTLYLELGESRSLLMLCLNHTADPDLKQTIEHFIADVLEPQMEKLEQLLRHEGIDLPTVTPAPAKVDVSAVPDGAKMRDEQIAQMIVVKVVGLLEYTHNGLMHTLRDDIGRIFYSFQGQVLAQGYTLKHMMRQRGWLRVPPYHRTTVGTQN